MKSSSTWQKKMHFKSDTKKIIYEITITMLISKRIWLDLGKLLQYYIPMVFTH